MRHIIKKILKESKSESNLTIAGVNFSINDYVSTHSSGKSDIFLIVAPKGNGINPEKFLEIKSIFENVGIEATPQAYNSDGNTLKKVYEIRLNDIDLTNVLKIYL